MKAIPVLAIPETHHQWIRYRLAVQCRFEGDCIIWTGQLDRGGYGVFKFRAGERRSRQTGAHRAAWLVEYGPISDPALQVDHLCRRRDCINPDHLELVTSLENNRRRVRATRIPYSTSAVCGHGHPLGGANSTYTHKTRAGYVVTECRACVRQRGREWRERKKLVAS